MSNNGFDLRILLESYHSSHKLVYKANPGNAGDGVIASASYDFFDRNDLLLSKYNKDEVYSSDQHVLIFGGGGNLIEGLYSEGKEFIENNINKFHRVIIMPSTIKGYEYFFRENIDKLIVLCRESISLEYFKSIGYNEGNNLSLTDDMAFYLEISNYMSFVDPIKDTANCFRKDSESLNGEYKENNHDISLTWNGNFWDNIFLSRNSTRCMINFLEEYTIVNTDRLHVAILASLLGKEVNFYPNSYYKNEAVYNYSLFDHYPKTTFIKS
ncbi:Exopolysaccharide biosynthesis protein EpsI, predicted pyruvyl transferase [Rosenbergiella nectarea]|uniref:Exopolysaccharide biosynthesis protein EpsI, predicted pyruvyl transferase n=1 Tax=Rosenbergiella nectarea TaxID=988801 RepID=A0A1H9DAZ3_9GAMM|nr:polysaccharide pyruvyl transferase family protein [Rosenbergiella nectarea]SEQ10487.1 Exopolysaccharide biosynthesis protein EpsI, predicted pyruvyl transferase [Rosenbergiella nectarea]